MPDEPIKPKDQTEGQTRPNTPRKAFNSMVIDPKAFDSFNLDPNLGIALKGFESAVAGAAYDIGKILGPQSQASLKITTPTEQKLEQEIAGLKKQLNEQQKTLIEERRKSGETTKLSQEQKTQVKELRATVEQLQRKQALSFVLNRIREDVHEIFLGSDSFQAEFLFRTDPCSAYVMAVDLRRSTELMLKSRRPEMFAKFITELSSKLRSIILKHNGVFDKFTGDGILAFFPTFFSGNDAGYYVVHAADECHKTFSEHYKSHYGSFDTVLKDIGLGIGIDFGDTHLVRLDRELAIVGRPVVYASRMAGVGPGVTLLNQPAYETIFGQFSAYCSFEESQIDVKHEGIHVGYTVRRNRKQFDPAEPEWFKYMTDVEPPKATPVREVP